MICAPIPPAPFPPGRGRKLGNWGIRGAERHEYPNFRHTLPILESRGIIGLITLDRMKSVLRKPLIKGLLLPVIGWLALSLIFSLAYTQSPLYNDNQNTKFLHGLAMGGLGLLKEDWMANTTDPLPVFSLMVSVTYAFLSQRLFYVYFALLMGIYAYSMMGIASTLHGMGRLPAKYLAYFALILAVHSIQGQIFARKTLGFDLELLNFGLAGQYLLGLDFQNSSFGVFLLLSIHAFLRRRYVWAILWLSLASIFHPAYLFSAGLLTAAYLGSLFFENISSRTGKGESNVTRMAGAARQPFLLGLLALLLVFPVVIYQQIALSTTSPGLSAQALDILVNQRIPHHSLPRVWMNTGAYIQIAIMVAGLMLVRKTRLFPVMLAPFLGGALGTLAQILTGSANLALLAPWRVSVFLVPLSTCLLIAWPVDQLFKRFQRQVDFILPVIVVLSLAAIITLDIQGLTVQRGRFARYERMDSHPMMYYVRQSKAPGQVYLIPPRDNRFDEFRLFAGAPAFINWKTHPYRDFEVVEWYNRNRLARDYYTDDQAAACAALKAITGEYKLTHVVVNLEAPYAVCDGMQETYRDKHYAVYAIQ